MKIRSELFGCYEIDIPACGPCGADLYSGEFVQAGRFEPTISLGSSHPQRSLIAKPSL
jgi:hypothetical protein